MADTRESQEGMTHQAALDVELLEPLLREFVAHIGLAKTMLIVDRWGGLPIYIAANPDEGTELARLVGLEAAVVLGRAYPGSRLPIPKAGAALRAIRDQRICAEHARLSIRQLVQAYGLSERRICEILAAGPQDLGALFD